MRIFITGGTGFIGTPLCQALASHELMILSRKPITLKQPSAWRAVQGDLADSQSWKPSLESFQPEVCIHVAWSGLPDYSISNNIINFEAGLQLFQSLAEIQCKRVVVTGTCFEYGDLKGCLTEDQTPSCQGLFASFKSAQRLVGNSLFSRSRTSFIWTRPFFVYGPGQRSTSLIPSAVRSLSAGMNPDIRTPDVLQDFIHVNDVAAGLAMLATSDTPAGTYNLGSGRPVLVRDLVNLIARFVNHSDVYPMTGQIGEGFWANTERVSACLHGWSARSVEQGIRETLGNLDKFINRAA